MHRQRRRKAAWANCSVLPVGSGERERRLPAVPGGADKTVDVHVSWLRRKLGETAQQPRYLHTVRGVGIKLSPPP